MAKGDRAGLLCLDGYSGAVFVKEAGNMSDRSDKSLQGEKGGAFDVLG